MKLAVCFLILLHHSQSLRNGPVVQISEGKLQGVIEDSVLGKQYVAFKGIPYAKPPVGELRFRDPIPVEPWTSILNASSFGEVCPQLHIVFGNFTGNEDCLFLNVYTPPDFNPSTSSPKAVMFWIYGGSFFQGDGDDVLYGPDYLVAKDVVVVTINYRLDALGFLNVESGAATGNQGLKDQILALKWVQRNIAHFGGDPNSVTIFGESAGAASVHYLALSSLADGLYHKVIAQSGTILCPWGYLPYSPKIHAEELAAALGNQTKDPEELVEFLRGIDALRLVRADLELLEKLLYGGLSHFIPSVDNKSRNPVFPKPVMTAVRSGVRVPFLLGYMAHEGIGFVGGVDDEKWRIFNSDISKALSPGALNLLRYKGITLEELRERYFGDKNISEATRYNYVQMQTDLQFVYGIHDALEIQASVTDSPTYLYNFTFTNGRSLIKEALGINMPGACHADDLAYIFYPRYSPQDPPESLKPITRTVIDRVTQMWTNFAKTGNPTPAVSNLVPVVWKPVKNSERFEYLEISDDLKVKTVTNINKRYPKKSNCHHRNKHH